MNPVDITYLWGGVYMLFRLMYCGHLSMSNNVGLYLMSLNTCAIFSMVMMYNRLFFHFHIDVRENIKYALMSPLQIVRIRFSFSLCYF